MAGALSDVDGVLDPGSGTHLGDFTLLRRLGRGAQGEVYEARQESLGRLVALKILPAYLTFNHQRVLRFRREAEAGGRLDHPNTVGVHAVGEHEGCHFIVQELVAGGQTLGDRIAAVRREGELPRDWFEATAHLFVQVAEAVDAAHEAGIIHRDLKPGNILLTQDGTPKVADFGLAMVEDDLHRSLTGELIGTPFYMSPEQGTGSRTGIDRRTDVFSLGVTLYETLTLVRPFDAETRDQVVELIRGKDPRDPRKVRHAVPRELALICMKALEKRRERRYQTAGELADDLRRYLAHEPIRARAPGVIVRTGKWVRRHPVRTGFALTYALVVVLLDSTWRENRRVVERDGQLEGLVKTLVNQSLLDPVALSVDRPQPRPAPNAPILADINSALRVAAGLDEASALREAAGHVGFQDEHWYLLVLAGVHLRNLSLFDRAESVLKQSIDVAHEKEERDGFGPERVSRSEIDLGKLYRWTGRNAEAEPLLRDARTILVERFGATSEKAFEPTIELARALADTGRMDEALAMLQDLHADLGDDGDELPRKLQTAEVIGGMLLEAGRLDDAEPWLLPAYDKASGVVPELERLEWGVSVARLFGQRGLEAKRAGRDEEAAAADARAEDAFTTVIAGLEASLPETQLALARVQTDYGVFLRKRDRLPEARAVLEEALQSSLLLVGPDDPATLNARNNLATAANYQGDVERAEAELLEIVASDRRGQPADLPAVLTALENLAALYCNAGRLAEAAQYGQEALDRSLATDPKYGKRVSNLEEIQARLAAPPATTVPSNP